MKKILITATVMLACVAAFAQGKVNFQNNTMHLAYFDTGGNLRAQDASLAGQGPTSTVQPIGVTLVVDLYAGTSSSSLALISTTTFGATVGQWPLGNVILPTGFAGGSTGFFQVEIRDNAYQTAALSQFGGSYYSTSEVFSLVMGSGVLYSALYNHNSPVNSTWLDGTYNMDTQSGVTGARGSMDIRIANIPEPSAFALSGLGAAALLIFRRRK